MSDRCTLTFRLMLCARHRGARWLFNGAGDRNAGFTRANWSNAQGRFRCGSNHGFTLLEVVVALALAATLMVLLLQSTVSVRRSHAAIDDPDMHAETTTALVELLHQDLAHARQIAVRKNAVRITGHFGLDPDSQAPDHRPTQVTYALIPASALSGADEPHGGGRLLVREQIRYAATNDHVGSVEILSWHMDRLDLASPNLAELSLADSADWQRLGAPLPDWAMLTLVWRDGRRSETMMVFK